MDSNQILAWVATAAFAVALIMHLRLLIQQRKGRWVNLFVFAVGWIVCGYFAIVYALVGLDLAPSDWPPPIEAYILQPAVPLLAAIIVSYPALLLQLQQHYTDYTALVERVVAADKNREVVATLEKNTIEFGRRIASLEQAIDLYKSVEAGQQEKIERQQADIDKLLAENEELRQASADIDE